MTATASSPAALSPRSRGRWRRSSPPSASPSTSSSVSPASRRPRAPSSTPARARRGLWLTQVAAAARAGTPHTLRVEVEVTTYAEAEEALAAGTDVILLDNMGVEEMARCVRLAKGRAVTEASGGVTLANVRAIAEPGVDVISSGALTHSAPALDISLEIETAPAQTLSGGTGGAAPWR